MTLFIKYILVSLILFNSCNKEEAPQGSTFCTEDPLQQLTWLKNLVEDETNDDSANSSGLEIIQYEYQNNLAFSINDCVNNCSDASTRIYDCKQNQICEFGGIAGVDTCTDFFKEAKNESVLFSTKNNTILSCEKSLVIDESLYNSSESTAITNAEIKENCLYLTFTILSTQDRIKDVNLVDSGQVLESFPIQRNLKLVVTENLTKPTSIAVTTSFDLSVLVDSGNTDPIILNIDGYDTPLKYQSVSQSVDSNDQLTEAKEIAQQYNDIKELASTTACTDAKGWKITPLGSKACGGPIAFIAYPNTIDDEADFLSKVETLKKAEDAFNKKWGIVSDCALAVMPSGVVCEDGKAVLVP